MQAVSRHLPAMNPVRAAVVTFSPVEGLARYRRHLGIDRGLGALPVLSDIDRVVYRRLDLERAPLHRVYNPRTLLMYARGLLSGRRIRLPVDDTRQLGADVVLDRTGLVVSVTRSSSPDDRPSMDTLARLVTSARR